MPDTDIDSDLKPDTTTFYLYNTIQEIHTYLYKIVKPNFKTVVWGVAGVI